MFSISPLRWPSPRPRLPHTSDAAVEFRPTLCGLLAALLSKRNGHLADGLGESFSTPERTRENTAADSEGRLGYRLAEGFTDFFKFRLLFLGDVHASSVPATASKSKLVADRGHTQLAHYPELLFCGYCCILLLMAIVALLLLAAAGWSQTGSSPTDLKRVVPGVVAPDFELPSSAGGTLKLSSLRGKNVVLVFYRGYW
jgi:hypothetical protein